MGKLLDDGKTLEDYRAQGTWKFWHSEVHWGMVEDYRQHPAEPEVPCPTLIFHGLNDNIVPIAVAQVYAGGRGERVQLRELADDHVLGESMPAMIPEISAFFDLSPALKPPEA